MPNFLDRRQSLTIERVLNGNCQPFSLAAADHSKINGSRYSDFDEVARIEGGRQRSGGKVEPKNVTVKLVEDRRMRIAIRQDTNRNLLILLT
jgi:hypothetical protein